MPDLFHQFIVNAPAIKVFDAFCRGLDAWWTQRSAGALEPHAEYTFYFGPEHDWRARVTHVLPGQSLTWKMTRAMDDWMGTEMGFQLKTEGSATSVFFFHRHWKAANEHFAITNYCWGQLLRGLKDYVENGVVIPFNKRN